MGAESGMNSSVRDDRVALSDGAKALWGKTNRIDDSEWLPLYVHMVDSAAMASKIWDTWVPQGTKAVIVGDLGNDEVLARKLMIFMAGIHDIGKATPVFQAKSITFGPEAGSFAWKAERAGLPMIAGLRGTNHPTHPIAGEIILEGYLLRVRGWERKAARQYACVVGGHHGTPPDKSKIDEEKNRKTNVGLDSEAWVSTQDELIDFVANIAGIEEKEWEDLSERRFSVQSAVLMTGLVIMADWIASNSDEDMFPLVRTEPWADEDEDFFFSESGEEDDIQSWSGLRIRADRAWSCVQLPHAWVPEGIPSSCQDLFATRFTLPEGAKVRPVQEEAVRIARDTRQPGLMVIEAPMGEGKTEAALAAAEILAQRTGRGGVCVALPTMATTDAMFTRVRRWLEALPSCDFDNEKTVWLAHGKAQLNNDFRGIIAASHRRFSSVDQDDVKQESSQNRKKKQIDVPPETVVSDWLWGRKKGALANFLVCTVDQVLMSALQMKHVVLRQLAMANKVVIIDECHAYDAYMQEYLKMALEWLGGYRTPVILLSATLPECQRNAMVEAYLKGWCDTEPRKASKVSILEQLRARNASNTHHINHTANSEMSCEKGTAEKLRLISNAYPLLTYTDGHETKHADVKPSGRSMKVQCRLVDDDDTALLDLMDALLVDGGCIGVICDTVGRAQHAAELLGNHCGRDCVRLTHSRFMDIDRMSNERELRDLLGPDATIGNGKRPGKLVVVGTQVLEQSLDIDFDALVTDIAPVDLIMQRLGRVHRHRRGDGECDRPVSLQTATCYIRGVEAWNNHLEGTTMFISRIPLNKVRYGARQLIGSPYKLHAAVEAAFPPDAVRRTDDGRILWRLDSLGQDGGVWLYVVSPQKPDFTHIVEQAGWPMHAEWETKNYDALLDRVTKGQQWHFKLRANPARKAGVDKGRRHRSDGIVGKVQGHVTASQQLQWLVNRSVVHGFRILEDEYGQPNVVVKERHKEQFKRGGATVTLVTAVFEGRLEVIDTKLFRDALCEGIGRAKGFGCGLLTIAPETRSNAE